MSVERSAQLLARSRAASQAIGNPLGLAVSARSRGLVLAARGELGRRGARPSDEALEAHERCARCRSSARGRCSFSGRVRRRLKQKRWPARRTRGRARRSFEELGADLWAERAREELRRVTTRKAPETLTATERADRRARRSRTDQPGDRGARVRHAKDGRGELARVYRKLGISVARTARTGARRGAGPLQFRRVFPPLPARRPSLASKA